MRTITKEELKEILRLHKMWLDGEDGGVRADLCGANLRGANLRYANLRNADLRNADLCGADLCGANLRSANLRYADLCGANLRGANLRYADLRGADLCGANLCSANLCGANLCGANLRYADLCGANLRYANLCNADLRNADLCGANLRGANLENVKCNEYTSFFALQCPECGSFIGYKKCKDILVTLEITEDAKRSSATSRKCRCSKAKVIDIEGGVKAIPSDHDPEFIYTVGETVEVKDFDDNRWNECSTGIHFFITKEEAK